MQPKVAYYCKKVYIYAISTRSHALPGKVNAFLEKSVRVSGKSVPVSGCSGTFWNCINMQVREGGIVPEGPGGGTMLPLAEVAPGVQPNAVVTY